MILHPLSGTSPSKYCESPSGGGCLLARYAGRGIVCKLGTELKRLSYEVWEGVSARRKGPSLDTVCQYGGNIWS
jgi:hypothetical protein